MRVIILKDPNEVAIECNRLLIEQLNTKPNSVLGLATGSTPTAFYKQAILACHKGELSFKQVSTFNLDEYLGIPASHTQSYRTFMQQALFDHVDIDLKATHVLDGMTPDPKATCAEYEALIDASGGIDFQVLGIGRNGHIGFNEPSSSLASRTRVKALTEATIEDNSRFFSANEFQPNLCLTMGIGTIMDARRILLLATGSSKSFAVKQMVEGPVSAACPASILQMHPEAIIVLDEAAAGSLSDVEFYQFVEVQNRQLESQVSFRQGIN